MFYETNSSGKRFVGGQKVGKEEEKEICYATHTLLGWLVGSLEVDAFLPRSARLYTDASSATRQEGS